MGVGGSCLIIVLLTVYGLSYIVPADATISHRRWPAYGWSPDAHAQM
jgi:hypothetical protein